MDTTRNGCNGTVSTVIETGLVFLEIQITKMANNSVVTNISNGADSAATKQENAEGILVTDKNVSEAKNTLGFHTTFEVTISTTLEVYNIPTTLEVYNIPGNTLEVSSIPTADNALEAYHIPGNMLEVHLLYTIFQTQEIVLLVILIHMLVVSTS